jgi:hypothetical protein
MKITNTIQNYEINKGKPKFQNPKRATGPARPASAAQLAACSHSRPRLRLTGGTRVSATQGRGADGGGRSSSPVTIPVRLRAPRSSPHLLALIEPTIPDSTGLGRGYPRRWRMAVSGGAAPASSGHLRSIQARYELHRPRAHQNSLARGAETDQRGLATVALNSGEARSWWTRLVRWSVPARLRRDRALHLQRTHYDHRRTPCAP